MRKKMNRLEEESNQRSALSVDRDDAILTLQVVYQLIDLDLSVKSGKQRQL